MGRHKGGTRPEGAGPKKGQKYRKTIERELVVQAWVDLIHEHTETIFNKLLEGNPAALATFLGKVSPTKLEHSGSISPFAIVELPIVEKTTEVKPDGEPDKNTAQ